MTEEELDHKLQTLNSLKEQQKSLFDIIVKRFIETLAENTATPDVDIKVEDGEKPIITNSPYWPKWASERFEDVFLAVIFY